MKFIRKLAGIALAFAALGWSLATGEFAVARARRILRRREEVFSNFDENIGDARQGIQSFSE